MNFNKNQDNNNQISFSEKDFNPNQQTKNKNSDYFINTTLINTSTTNKDLTVNNSSNSPKFNCITKEDFLNDITNIEKDIPNSEFNLINTIKHEIIRRESQKSIIEVDNNERDYPKKSHWEFLRIIKESKDPLNSKYTGGLRMISREELGLHNKKDDLWVELNGNVYDLTMYLQYHPGGEKMLMKAAGKESIDMFNYHHNWVNYNSIIGKLQIGYLSDVK